MTEHKTSESAEAPVKMSKEEQIGFHKGSIAVLAKEREELLRIVSITEALLQMHTKSLADLGVDISALQKDLANASAPKKRVPIENLI